MRAAVVGNPNATPVYADFPEPQQQPGQEPLHLVGAGLHHVVRGLASGPPLRQQRGFSARPADGRSSTPVTAAGDPRGGVELVLGHDFAAGRAHPAAQRRVDTFEGLYAGVLGRTEPAVGRAA
jgi:hypothetical protein